MRSQGTEGEPQESESKYFSHLRAWSSKTSPKTISFHANSTLKPTKSTVKEAWVPKSLVEDGSPPALQESGHNLLLMDYWGSEATSIKELSLGAADVDCQQNAYLVCWSSWVQAPIQQRSTVSFRTQWVSLSAIRGKGGLTEGEGVFFRSKECVQWWKESFVKKPDKLKAATVCWEGG